MNIRISALSVISLFLLSQVNYAQQKAVVEPAYVNEAPLPKGWPKPGPYNKVTEKKYPAYRAAVTKGRGSSFAFWRLFRHIKNNNIPMTAPVEMGMKDEEGKALAMHSMAFLYQGPDVGKKGADGAKVTVVDVPVAKALSYAWQGDNNKKAIQRAKNELLAELSNKRLKHSSFRLLGYNGPSVAKDKKTWELQAVLK